jgi:AAA+ ATPase superfamily predicted ATPase
MKFYDREKEIELLNTPAPESLKEGRFTMMVGRRRIGKTALLLEAFRGQKVLYLFVAKQSEAVLCAQFQQEAERALEDCGWHIAGTLTNFIDLFRELLMFGMKRNFTLIIDEFQNLESVNPSLFSEIQNYWDQYKGRTKVNLIACGSIYSMMIRIFGGMHEPLFGRATAKFTITPFSTRVIKQILKDYNPAYSAEDLLCLYLLTGGVPYYIGVLMDAKAWTKTRMLKYALSENSIFITDGRDLLLSEFGRNYGEYFSILQLIARGKTTQAEIDSVIGKNTGSYIANLETDYSLIKRNRPLFSKPQTRNSRWLISDNYLRFYFRYIEANQALIETRRFDTLYELVSQDYETYSGYILENYFRQKIAEEGSWTNLGGWWDRKGVNEIDIAAVDDLKKTAVIYEVKRQKKKIDLAALALKAEALKPELAPYKLKLQGLSMEDM